LSFAVVRTDSSPGSGRRCAVNRITIYGEPVADRAQAFLKLRLDGSVGPWTDIEQKTSSTACDLDQASNQELGGLEIILNTASRVGLIGQQDHAVYVATKGAMISLAKAMAATMRTTRSE